MAPPDQDLGNFRLVAQIPVDALSLRLFRFLVRASGICGPSYWARAVFPGIRTYPRKIPASFSSGEGSVSSRSE